jgi:hypothetical protein
LNDSDGFGALFAGNAGLARQIVDRAIDDWEAVIQNFNYSDGGNTFNLQVVPGSITAIANSNITNITNGKPTSATITIQNMATTHWLDTTPLDNVEFAGNVANAFTGFAAGISGTDLYATIIHEIGHSVGISQQFSTLSIAGFTTNTGIDDPNSATAGNLLAFNVGGGAIEATFTASDSGHIWEGPATAATNAAGLPVHLNDLMNSGRAIASNERNLISNTDATILQLAYGYTIVLPSTLGTFYDRLDPDGTLTIQPPAGNNNDALDLQISGGNLLVTLGLGAPVPGADPSTIISTFPTNLINSIVINMSDGTDTVTIHSLYGSMPIALNMGSGPGFDVLNIWGGAGYDSITVNSPSLVSTGITLTSFSNVDALNLYTNGGDADIYMPYCGSADTATINGSGSAEYITLHSLGLFTPVAIFGNGGNDTLELAPNGGTDIIRAAVTVDGGTGADTLKLGNGTLASLTAAVTFNGGTGFEDKVVFNDQSTNTATSYSVTSTTVTRSPAFGGLTYADLDRIVINCGSGADTVAIGNGVFPNVEAHGNNGNDNFIVGGGNLTGIQPQSFDGGDGFDQVTFDNHLDATNRIWDMRNNEIFFGGLIVLSTTSFESVGVLGGSGQDEFDFKGVLGQGFNVDGGLNTDTFVLGYNGSVYFNNPVTLLGGDGGDVFTINDAAVSAFTTLTMDGSDFVNTMYVNEPLATGYYLGPGYFTPKVGASTQGTFGFGNILTTIITGTSGDNDFTIYSAGVSLGTYTINGGSGNDSFVLAPQLSGYSFKGLTINGQPGTDTFTFEASGLNTNETYTIGTNKLDIQRGVSTDTVTITSMDSVTLNCGLGNDTITVNEYFAGIPVTINGGIGDDAFEIMPISKNLAANMAATNNVLSFNGGTGHDTIGIHNENNNNGNSYTVDGSQLSVQNRIGFPSFAASFAHTGVEYTTVNAGPQSDSISIISTATDTVYDFDGGPGAVTDSFAVGYVLPPSLTSVIRGGVRLSGAGGGNDTIDVFNNSDTIGRTFHIENGFVGRMAGDDLFGPGGYLEYVGIAGPLTVRLGSGSDVVYAAPHSVTPIIIQGNNPTTAPGDTLNLDLASAVNYVITPTSPTSGNVTSDNLKTLTFSGFETIPNAPQFLQSISFTGAYSQNFDALPTSGTTLAWANNSTLAGWSLYRQPATGTAITTIDAGTGSSSTGSFYSFGVLGSGLLTDRALGGLGSGAAYFGSPVAGTVAGWIALGLTNNTGAPINKLTLGYDGEQWRDGGNTSSQVMKLEYGFGNSFSTVPTWAAPGGSFDFTSPIHTAVAATLDGNAAGNRTTGLGGTFNNLGWTAGSTLWVRWVESNDAGNDHALAIDNIQFTLPAAFFGDFNGDSSIDASDFVVWRKTLGTIGVPAYSGADGDGDGMIDQDDYGVLRAHYGKILPAGAASGMGSVAAGTSDTGGQSEINTSFATLAEPLARDSQQGAGNREPPAGEPLTTMTSAPVVQVWRSVFDAVGGRTALPPGACRVATVESRVSANRHDAALLTWVSTEWDRDSRDRGAGDDKAQDKLDSRDSVFASLNRAFADFEYDVTHVDLLTPGASE